MTKAELIKQLEALQNKKEAGKSALKSSEKEQLLNDIHKKDVQIKKQKKEMAEKQNQLKKARDKFFDFYDYSPSGYLTTDEHGIIKEINLTAAEMLGAEINSLANSSFLRFLASNDLLKFLHMLKNCKQSYEQISDELTIILQEKENLFILLTAVPFHDYKTKKIFFRIYFTDISEQKKSEIKLSESEKRFRLMADSASVMIWMTDVNHRLEYMNKTRLEFLGKNFSELAKDNWIKTIHPDDRDLFLKKLQEAAEEKRNFSIELRIKNKDGDYQWLFETAAPRLLEDKFIGFIGSGIDITENKNFRMHLQKSLKEKEILLREVHHRVKNNLQVISSMLNLQSAYIKDKEALDIFKSSRNRVRSMAILHEKIYRSKSITEIDLKEYLNEVILSLFDSYQNSTEVNLKLDVADINIDIGLSITIGLITSELVSNSLKHAFKGRKKGEINVKLGLQKQNQLELLVSDNGAGLPKDFSPNKNRSFGLELISALAEQHSGSLEIGRPEKSEFKVHLNLNNN